MVNKSASTKSDPSEKPSPLWFLPIIFGWLMIVLPFAAYFFAAPARRPAYPKYVVSTYDYNETFCNFILAETGPIGKAFIVIFCLTFLAKIVRWLRKKPVPRKWIYMDASLILIMAVFYGVVEKYDLGACGVGLSYML